MFYEIVALTFLFLESTPYAEKQHLVRSKASSIELRTVRWMKVIPD